MVVGFLYKQGGPAGVFWDQTEDDGTHFYGMADEKHTHVVKDREGRVVVHKHMRPPAKSNKDSPVVWTYKERVVQAGMYMEHDDTEEGVSIR